VVLGEELGADHNTGLFIAIDGPFDGANIPIGFQAASVDLGQYVAAALQFKTALESPAASQLLRRTFPRGAELDDSGWYAPRPEFVALNNLLSGILPNGPRNVAAANGSATGSTQGGLTGRQSLLEFEIEDFDGGFLSVDIAVDIWSDGTTAFFPNRVYGRTACVISLPGAGCIFELDTLKAVFGVGADLAPGSYRRSTRSFLNALATVNAGNVTTSFAIDRHNFVAPSSAIGGGEPWDNVVYEKCNQVHGPPAPMGLTLAMQELFAFRDGAAPPPQPPLYTTACGAPEPVEFCYPGVFWYQDPDDPEFIEPWADPANCYVHPIPGGQTPVSSSLAYATEPSSSSCADGSTPGPNGCPYFEVDGSFDHVQVVFNTVRIWVFTGSPASC
ncbi:MAG: hypothetical protein AAFX50_23355, partial [Acidobacteriota bacterium]